MKTAWEQGGVARGVQDGVAVPAGVAVATGDGSSAPPSAKPERPVAQPMQAAAAHSTTAKSASRRLNGSCGFCIVIEPPPGWWPADLHVSENSHKMAYFGTNGNRPVRLQILDILYYMY